MPSDTSTEQATEIDGKSWMPGRNGGKLRRGGPGRPKMRDTVTGHLREFMLGDDEKAGIVDALIVKAMSGDTRAIELCLHYGIGKPTDKVELSGPDGGPIQHATEDLDDHERRALRDAITRELQQREAKEPA